MLALSRLSSSYGRRVDEHAGAKTPARPRKALQADRNVWTTTFAARTRSKKRAGLLRRVEVVDEDAAHRPHAGGDGAVRGAEVGSMQSARRAAGLAGAEVEVNGGHDVGKIGEVLAAHDRRRRADVAGAERRLERAPHAGLERRVVHRRRRRLLPRQL